MKNIYSINASLRAVKAGSWKKILLAGCLLNAGILAAEANTFTTVAAGSYSDPITWGGAVPSVGDSITIAHNITLDEAVSKISRIKVISGGSLTVNGLGSILVQNDFTIESGAVNNVGGTILVGDSSVNNKTLSLSGGTLVLSGGTIKVNGNVMMAKGNFTMSGGTFVIDPNSGAAATSVANDKDIFALSSDVTGTVNGGIIKFVDPPYAGLGRTFAYTGATGNANWAGNTLIFGDAAGANTLAGSKNGFNVDTRASGSSYIKLGNVTANGGKGTNRFVSGSAVAGNGFDIGGNIVINTYSEIRTLAGGALLRIAGNITNNGMYYDMAGILFGDRTGPNTVAQYVTNNNGKGKFYNSTRPTASFTSLEFNNTASPIAVTFNFGDGIKVDGAIMVSGKVAFTNGVIDIGSDNQFIFGIAATASRINGGLLRGFGPGGGAQMSKQYPIGASSFTYHIIDNIGDYNYTPATVNFTANSFSSKVVAINVWDKSHPSLKTGGTPADYLSRYWRVVFTPIGTHTATITLNYLNEDVVGTESLLQMETWNGTKWASQAATLSTSKIAVKVTEKTLSGGTLCEITGRKVAVGRSSASLNESIMPKNGKVSVFPNPVTSGKVNLQLSAVPADSYNVSVFNSNGQQIFSKSLIHGGGSANQILQLPTSLATGIYRMVIRNGKNEVTNQNLYLEN